MARSSPFRDGPRGYALMLALVLTATVLGGSALVLQKTLVEKQQLKKDRRDAIIASALQQSGSVAERFAFKPGALFTADGQKHAPLRFTLGEIDVTLTGEPGPEPDKRIISVAAKKGNFLRGREYRFQRVPSLGVAIVGRAPPAQPGVEVRGGAGSGHADVVERLAGQVRAEGVRTLIAPGGVVDLPEEMGPALRIDGGGQPLVLQPVAPFRRGPLNIAILNTPRIEVQGDVDLRGVVLQLGGAEPLELRVPAGSALRLLGGLVLDGPLGRAMLVVDEGGRLEVVAAPDVVAALVGGTDPGWLPVANAPATPAVAP